MDFWNYSATKRLLFACFMAITFCLTPLTSLALAADLSPAVLDLTKQFSEKFCISITNGARPKKAGEIAAAQLSKGLLFSPVMNEIMSAPKEDLAASLANNIFNECGNDLGGTKEDLDLFLVRFANKIPNKSTNNFRLPPIRQKPSI